MRSLEKWSDLSIFRWKTLDSIGDGIDVGTIIENKNGFWEAHI